MAFNARDIDILERHLALPRRDRMRIERLMTTAERAALRQFQERKSRGERPEIATPASRLFDRHSPRLKLILTELVDENFKVKGGVLAPAAVDHVQDWVAKLTASGPGQSSQLGSLTGVTKWVAAQLSNLGLGQMKQGRPL